MGILARNGLILTYFTDSWQFSWSYLVSVPINSACTMTKLEKIHFFLSNPYEICNYAIFAEISNILVSL